MRGSKEVVELWFSKAGDDELSALSILKHREGTPSIVCFFRNRWLKNT